VPSFQGGDSNEVVYTGKPALGESVGAAGLWQVILAAQALRSAASACAYADPAIAFGFSLSRTPMIRRAVTASFDSISSVLRLAIR
jgi:3-oxoacyl-(acyl-carrier-protein) synthase